MKWIILLVLLIAPFVVAQEGSIKLLALVDKGDNQSGGIVDLNLEVLPGKERVFLETIPLTKITTQISMRFAQQISCKELDVSCEGYDFFYTLEGFPGVVGGPSAGAAATILTVSVLQNQPLNTSVAITGTINSGATIGPVGGIKHKIDAAAANGIATVLIPKGSRMQSVQNNVTIDIVAHGESLGLTVVEVATLDEALPYFGLESLNQEDGDLQLSPHYVQTMERVAEQLCDRSSRLRDEVQHLNEDESGLVGNYSTKMAQSMEMQNYYAAASFCFRQNVILNQARLEEQNLSSDQVQLLARERLIQARQFSQQVRSKPIDTLTDLQVLMAVDERVEEAIELFERAQERNSTLSLGYGEERLISARTWSSFFNGTDKAYVIDEERLKKSCVTKLGEVEERYSYVLEFVRSSLRGIREDIDGAYAHLHDGNYVACLYTASRSKAEIDSLLSLVGVEDIGEVIDVKLDATRFALLKAQREDVFPIISYNYYQYAQSLKGHDDQSALLFAEYALEFSALDVYFDRQELRAVDPRALEVGPLEAFMIGVGVGLVIAMIYFAFTLRVVTRSRKTLQAPPKRRPRGKKR